MALGNRIWLNLFSRKTATAWLMPLLICGIAISPLFAQDIPDEPTDGFYKRPVTSRADTSSPRATLTSFLDACEELHALILEHHYLDPELPAHRALSMRILDCLDTSQLPEYSRVDRGGEAAVCLKEILDREELPSVEDIPDADAFQDLDAKHAIFRWRIPGTRITIARVEEGPQRHEYLFTPGTVARAAEYYEDMKDLPYRQTGRPVTEGLHRWYISSPHSETVAAIVDKLPAAARDRKFGLTLWKWPGLLIALIVAIGLMACVYVLQRKIVTHVKSRGLFFYCISILFPIAAILIPIGFKRVVSDVVTLRATPLYIVSFAADLVTLMATAVVVFGVWNRIAEIIISSPRIHPKGLDAQLIRILAKLASLVGVAVIFLEGGKYLGIPLTTLLASAGVGGLAIALAAQDTLKSLFGTLTLMADKPFRVGERIVFQNYDGVVEDIGLRSTRVRLLTGHQVTVPNDELARIDIENVARRTHVRRVADIHIPLNTPINLVEEAVSIVRKLLEDHEGMAPGYPPRVFFDKFNDDSFNLRFFYWYHPPDYWQYLDFSQRLNVEICRAFEERDIPFSLPKRITYTSTKSKSQPVEVKLVDRSQEASEE